MSELEFEYYYGREAEQFSFYRVPRMLIKDERFKSLSSDAKLLYGLMLDRMGLSIKNQWFDDQNRAYIIYTVENIMDDLGCANGKAGKVIAELDSQKGIGLIERKKRGLGKPDIIYVKNFLGIKEKSTANPDESTDMRKSHLKECENHISGNAEITSQEMPESHVRKCENRTSGNVEITFQDMRKSNTNYTNINNTDCSYININNDEHPINQSIQENNTEKQMDETDETKLLISTIKENINYDYYMKNIDWHNKKMYEEIFGLICEVVCVKRKKMRISGELYPYDIVKNRFLQLDAEHIEYVMDQMKSTTSEIRNIKNYLITALFNAPLTINYFYQQMVQHDLNSTL